MIIAEPSTGAMIDGIIAFLSQVTFYTNIILIPLMLWDIVCRWCIYKKAGEPGWASLVPFYNSYVLFKIAFGNGWLFLLSLVPLANIVMAILLPFKLAKAFGKDIGWGFGLLFLNVIFYPMLAFGSSEYIGADR